jgi:hypothetical protein
MSLKDVAAVEGKSPPAGKAGSGWQGAACQPCVHHGCPAALCCIQSQVAEVLSCTCSSAGEVLLRRKLGFLNFSAAAGWDPTELLRVYLAAACDPNDQVSPGHASCPAASAASTAM